MRKLPYWSISVCTLFLACCFTACEFEIDKPGAWSPTVGIPLVNTTFGLDALIEELDEDDLLQSEANGQLLLVYRDSFRWQPNADLGLPDSLQLPIAEKDQTLVYQQPSGRRIDLIVLKGTSLVFQLSNPFPETVNFSLTFQNLTAGGNEYFIERALPAAQNGQPSVILVESPLEGYHLDLTNNINIQYTASLANGDPVNLPPYILTLRAVNYSYVEGYFGELTFDLPADTLDFEYLDSWDSGQIEFVEPELNFTFRHDIGIPLELSSNLLSVRTFQRGTIELEHPALDGGLIFAYPRADEVGVEKRTLWRFYRGNSNIAEAVSGLPDKLYYDLLLEANPSNNDNITNHLTDSSGIDVKLEAEIPLYASARNFELIDTFDLSFEDQEIREARQLDFKLIVGNGFPVEVGIQMYFLDGQEAVLDSLFTSGAAMLSSAEIGADGFAFSKIESTQEVSFSNGRLNKLLDETAFLRVVGLVETPQDGQVIARLSENDEIEIRLGVLATF